MKKLLLFVCFALGAHTGYNQITWSSPVTVTSGAAYGNLHPKISLNRNGDPLVLWGKNNQRAYISRWTGSSFSSPVALGNMSINFFAQSWAGPNFTTYGDTVYAVMKRTPETVNANHIYLVRSFDGGATFSDTMRVDNIDTNMSRFPTVTTDASGNPIVAFMKFNASFQDAQYVVCKSNDYGTSYTSDVQASPSSSEVCDCCPATVLSSGSKVAMLFRNNASNIRDIWTGVSSDGGATFPDKFEVDATNWMITSCPSSGPDGIILGDTLYSTFMSAGSGKSLVYFGKASLAGLTASHTAITGNFSGLTSQNYPRIANADSQATSVWVQNASSSRVIAYAFTDNLRAGFSGYSALPGASGTGIVNADVAMAPGVVHVVWQDDNTGAVKYCKGTYELPTTATKVMRTRDVVLYPNPASDILQLQLPKNAVVVSCVAYDALGRATTLPVTTKGNSSICSVTGMANGNYELEIVTDDKTQYSCKITISR